MRRLALLPNRPSCYSVSMNNTSRTRLAILGTMSELHRQPLPYDLARLSNIVVRLAPDLLCAEITPATWEQEDLSTAAFEVREALAPIVAATDIVLIPVVPTSERFADFTPPGGWRRGIVLAFDRLLRWGQLKAGSPEAINGVQFGVFCHIVCHLIEITWTAQDRANWEAQNKRMVESILRVIQRDPGRRVLVAAQCQRLHRLAPLLSAHAGEIEIVNYQEL